LQKLLNRFLPASITSFENTYFSPFTHKYGNATKFNQEIYLLKQNQVFQSGSTVFLLYKVPYKHCWTVFYSFCYYTWLLHSHRVSLYDLGISCSCVNLRMNPSQISYLLARPAELHKLPLIQAVRIQESS